MTSGGATTGTLIPGGASPFRPRLRLKSVKVARCLNVTGPAWKGNRKRTAGQRAFMANRWGIGSVNVTL
jgi:hypothetical protein